MQVISNEQVKKIKNRLNKKLKPFGFECKPFLIGWYNDKVNDSFKLKEYDYNTVAFIVISNGDMWYAMKNLKQDTPLGLEESLQKNPVHTTTRYYLQYAANSTLLGKYATDIIYDFDYRPNKQPKLLVQTAGHVAAMAYYYQRKDSDPEECKYGTAIHKEYGGWFGFRGAFVLKATTCPDLKKKEPVDVLGSDEKRQLLLKLFTSWDWAYRDIIPVSKRYNKEQAEFFLLSPDKRKL